MEFMHARGLHDLFLRAQPLIIRGVSIGRRVIGVDIGFMMQRVQTDHTVLIVAFGSAHLKVPIREVEEVVKRLGEEKFGKEETGTIIFLEVDYSDLLNELDRRRG